MLGLSHLPLEAIGIILGYYDSSYLAISLWICGDRILNGKLAKGLTYLDLRKCERGDFTFPRIVSEFKCLRFFSVHSEGSLLKDPYDGLKLIKSLPDTLDSLFITMRDSPLLLFYESPSAPKSHHPLGESHALDLDALFPRLRTLVVAAGEKCTPDLFPALPSSLTRLSVPFTFDYQAESSYLSKMPRGLLRLEGFSGFRVNPASETDPFLPVRLDCSLAPPGLEYMDTHALWCETMDYPADFWLPKSLLEIAYPPLDSTPWTPTLALTMPSKVHTLTLSNIDMASFAHTGTNWVAHLPRSLTCFTLEPPRPISFLAYTSSLPPGLTSLRLLCISAQRISTAFGFLSDSGGCWPKSLTDLDHVLHLTPSDIVYLPQTVLRLVLILKASWRNPGLLDTRLLPPSLTELVMVWDASVNVALDLRSFKLRTCMLQYLSNLSLTLRCPVNPFPATLVQTDLMNVEIRLLILSDFPTDLIDPIIGHSDSSYLVIKLWLCGDKKFNSRIARGLTYLNLKAHRFSSSTFPRLISNLRSLRHLSISSENALQKSPSDWPEVIKSLPSSLKSLSFSCVEDPTHFFKRAVNTTYLRGESYVDLNALFPRLDTLVLASGHTMTSDFFPALPASLTRLRAPVVINYSEGSAPLSKLPRGLRRLEGCVFRLQSYDAFRRDCALAPRSLEFLTLPPLSSRHVTEYWLPKSLLEVDWSSAASPTWTPMMARTMPSNLKTFGLYHVNLASFADTYTNYIADLPRTLTDFTLAGEEPIDFLSYARFLPRSLTSLRLRALQFTIPDYFGNWSACGANGAWPPGLTTLLLHTYLCPPDIVHLPKTIRTLDLSVRARSADPEASNLYTKLLPPSLTNLSLEWTSKVNVAFALRSFNLTSCTLAFDNPSLLALPCTSLKWLPDSLVTLDLQGIAIIVPSAYTPVEGLLPNLKTVTVARCDWEWFQHIPRGVEHFSIGSASGMSQSPLLATDNIFGDLPPTLKSLSIPGRAADVIDSFVLPPQRFDHLPHLTKIVLGCAAHVSSGMLRTLPRTLKELQICITDLNENDVPFIPPHLTTLFTEINKADLAVLAEHMTLAALAGLNGESSSIQGIAVRRVTEAAVNQ